MHVTNPLTFNRPKHQTALPVRTSTCYIQQRSNRVGALVVGGHVERRREVWLRRAWVVPGKLTPGVHRKAALRGHGGKLILSEQRSI